jgi:hypothetical protein
MQPGTVEWELNQRRLRAERREDDRQWAELQAKREAESKTLGGRLASILDRLNHCHRRERSTGRSYALTSLQNRLISIISSIEPAAALPMRGSATTIARHLARDNATLTRLRSRMKASPRDPYSP